MSNWVSVLNGAVHNGIKALILPLTTLFPNSKHPASHCDSKEPSHVFKVELLHKSLAQVSTVARYKLNSFGTERILKDSLRRPIHAFTRRKMQLDS